MSAEVVAAAIGITFLAAVCQSLTAFGFALIMVPLLSLTWEVKPAVVASSMLGAIITVPLAYEVRGHVRARRLVPMLLGSLLGIPLGIVILREIGATTLEVTVSIVVIVAALLVYFSPRPFSRSVPALSFVVGGISGTLRGATSMGGPPVILYTLTFETDIERFRATLLAFFLPTSLISVAGLAIAGLIDGNVLLVTGASLPALWLGLVGGRWLRSFVPEGLFRLIVLLVLLASSFAVLVAALG